MNCLADSRTWLACLLLFVGSQPATAAPLSGEEFFEKKIRPVLAGQCYECHSVQAKKTQGNLALDTRAGLLKGGDSGPILAPGKPDESLLLKSIRHADADQRMPKKRAKLDDAVIADFVEWVKLGVPIPLDNPKAAAASWEEIYQQRLKWWSLQAVQRPPLPGVKNAAWGRTEIDRFILARLEGQGITPVKEADTRTLIRRLRFALTGLPPTVAELDEFLKEANAKPQAAYEKLVDRLLASPQFGERWARHWMDVVHFADTHGYEWDHPAKGTWQYRDYLIRAFNADVPYRQLILEHIAGDLLPKPRIDKKTNVNESILGTVSMRLGERRHGDSAEFEGIHQEAIENVIDTISKTFLATTVACARCHDHKLDAISQRDYYALAGIFMSSRWVCRVADGQDSNQKVRDELKEIKERIRKLQAIAWLGELENLKKSERWMTVGADGNRENILYPWARLLIAEKKSEFEHEWKKLTAEYTGLQSERRDANSKNSRLIADFTTGKLPDGWHAEGFGMQDGFGLHGDFVVADAGPESIQQILPPGLYTHHYSSRLNGVLRSPLLPADQPSLSFQITAGGLAASHVVVDNALFPESRYRFLDFPNLSWLTLATLPDEIRKGRRIYVELNTKEFNNYYPPRTGLVAKYTPEQQKDPRSWFGVTRIYAGPPPKDELGRFVTIFNGKVPTTLKQASQRIIQRFSQAFGRFRDGEAVEDDVLIINDLLQQKLLTNKADATPHLAKAIADYREAETQLQAEHVVGSIADFNEGRDDRIAVRGSYTDLGDVVPRGNIRILSKNVPAKTKDSGRLAFAESIASANNPLTARVFVNRVWHYLYGEGLVTTVDDFGHLGEQPSHPELLDYLATRFVEEGWSIKKLIRMMVISSTWRQASVPNESAVRKDPGNRLWHHYPLRRLEAEAIRDSMLAVSGRLDPKMYGLPIDPYRRAIDADKRLFCGPLDGDGRRSIYTKMTLMEPPKFLALFNQPIPKVTVGRRDVTNVPDQALALLNDPFVIGQAEFWGKRLIADKASSADERIRSIFLTALGRPPNDAELDRFCSLANQLAELRKVPAADLLTSQAVWQDVAHAVLNLKEFIYVR
ncbi:MAG: PSD1 and planctomycete cytochrome C domain-containing protein [Planctomycetes bacterium]|nr:PSD1 and planctomycete cytochrome C domain-containing protein [Planctomycetota bacterium]